ncbi:type III-B CRISPR module RAMP protein Cmr4 [Thermocrinis sp.]
MRKETYLLKTITPLHIGAGQGLGYVDLPIVREVHTNFPYIPASGIKGALRNYYLSQLAKKKGESPAKLDERLSKGEVKKEEEDLYLLAKVFGIAGEGATKGSDLGAGKVIFSDGFIVLFPVKSINGIFSLITCPYVINRFYELMDLNHRMEQVDGEAKVLDMKSHLNVVNCKLMLEEFVFDVEEDKELDKFVKFFGDGAERRIVCVSDTDFKDFVSNYTEVQTHIRINPETGTVNEGALWTEEYVPAETIFAFVVIHLEELNFSIPETFHLGGDITTGKGFVKVKKLEVNQ